MTAKIIISAVNPEETRMGIVENGRLMEYVVERNNSAQLVGSIFLGRVCNVVRGIQAAFIDIGLDKNAFLYLGDKTGITEGQRVLVEITKDAAAAKAPRQRLIYRLPAGMRHCCRKQIIPAFRVKLPTVLNAAA